MRFSSYWFLALLFVFVVLGLAMGIGLIVLVSNWTHGALDKLPYGMGTLVVWFGCPTLCVVLMYQIAAQIEKRVHLRQRGERAKAKEERPKPRKRRKKQQF